MRLDRHITHGVETEVLHAEYTIAPRRLHLVVTMDKAQIYLALQAPEHHPRLESNHPPADSHAFGGTEIDNQSCRDYIL
eukprot:54392-Eustigmatos_ZCMA.PRE.1